MNINHYQRLMVNVQGSYAACFVAHVVIQGNYANCLISAAHLLTAISSRNTGCIRADEHGC